MGCAGPYVCPRCLRKSSKTAGKILIGIATAMDYDKTEIAATYDQARALAPETVRLWQDLLSVHIDRAAISLVIDLGCGTGRFSELLAAHFGVQVIGIDPSQKMVDQARRKPATGSVDYRQGSAEARAKSGAAADP
jgi:ubiquinone/menaquinone biosynthesis C-methylase UbiE